MPSTPAYGLRYLALTDAPNLAAGTQNLAEDVEDELARIDADTQIVRLGPNSKSVNTGALSGTTTSGTYADLPSGASFSFTKRHASTELLVDIHVSLISTATNTVAQFGVRINSVDYDITKITLNAASDHQSGSGTRNVASGLAAGTYTIQARWLRTTGTGTLTLGNDWFSMRVTEVSPA